MNKMQRTDTVHRVKMFKAKKTWVAMGATVAIMGLGNVITTSAKADTVSPAIQSQNLTTQSKTSTSQNVDDVKNDIKNDQDNINNTQNAINDAKDTQQNQQSTVNQDQNKINDTQNELNEAQRKHDQDQQHADNLAPKGYQDKENDVNKAQNDVNNANKAVSDDQDQVQAATNNKNKAQSDVNNAQKDYDNKQDAVNNAKSKADNAKNNLDNTDKTVKVHHPANEAKPGTLQDGTNINSENDLPTHLVKPSDADKYDSYSKQQAGGATLDSYWRYVGNDDHSSIIVDNHLTPEQQLEAAQYALTLINDFRRQHGLPPMKMSQISIQLAQNDADMRNKYGVSSQDHSYPGSEDQGGVTREQWDNSMIRTIDPNFDTANDNSHNYFEADQNLGDISMDYVPTMLALKVRILQIIQDMAYADADWDWLHTQAFLRNTPNIIGNEEQLDNIWFGLNICAADEYGTSAVLFDMFETWDTSNGATDKINHILDQNQIKGYVNNGYDTYETNPDYTKAQKAYDDAKANLASAESNLQDALNTLNSAKSNYTNASHALSNAISKLNADKSALAKANVRLSEAQKALDQAKKDHANELPAYEAALKVVQDDQKLIDSINDQLTDLNDQLAKDSKNLNDTNQKIDNLQKQLRQLIKKLADDEALLDQLNNADTDNNNSSSDADSDVDDNDTTSDTDDTDSNSNTNNENDAKHDSENTNSSNDTASDSNATDVDTKDTNPTNSQSHIDINDDFYTNGETRSSRHNQNNEVATRMNYYHFGKANNNVEKTATNNQNSKQQLPQTDENRNESNAAAAIGLSIATVVGTLGVSRLRRRNH